MWKFMNIKIFNSSFNVAQIFYQVASVLIRGIILIFVTLLSLGTNQVQKCEIDFSKGVNLDEVSKSLTETINLKSVVDDYSSSHTHIHT